MIALRHVCSACARTARRRARPDAYAQRAIALLAVAATFSACSPPRAQLSFGVTRSSLDIAFKEADLARDPVLRTRVIELPAEIETIIEEAGPAEPRRESLRPAALCPAPDPNQILIKEATISIQGPPAPGRYTYLTSGSVKVTLPAPLPTVQAPLPPRIRLDVTNVTPGPIPVNTLAGTASTSTSPSRFQWEESWGPVYGVTWKRTMLLRGDGVYVAKLVRDSGGGEARTFAGGTVAAAPLPPTVYQFGSPGESVWRIRTVDRSRSMIGLFEGEVRSREFTDLCGVYEDSYTSRFATLIAALDGSYRYETDPEHPARQTYATHMTPLPVREEIRVIETIQGTVPATVEWKYDAKLLSVHPEPIP